jgi:hypothetical protein
VTSKRYAATRIGPEHEDDQHLRWSSGVGWR